MSVLLDQAGVHLSAGPEGLAVSGVVGFDVAAVLAATGREWLAAQAAGTAVDFDLCGVEGVSSAALSVLLEWARCARQAGLEVRAVRLSAPLTRLTRLAGLDRLMPLAEAA
ncbi:STAS domain-containing protein [Halomonas sp. C05BenzN]|uniref:STAS domain-containing protein n=1 Tax=Halomonas sp. C05BenzN TaxID=3411041 RepID=UPI003B939AC6